MKAVLDTSVLVPTVPRLLLMAAAKRGLFVPFWSERILGEWLHAGARRGVPARTDIALARLAFPSAVVVPTEIEDTLPDPDDAHVIGAGVAAGAGIIVTLNLRDFPPRILSRYGLSAQHPDPFLLALLAECEDLRADANEIRGSLLEPHDNLRTMLKRSGLPRLGKAMS